jgi:hypothetical protein
VATIAIASSLAACGSDEDEPISEDSLRGCLADGGLGAKPPRGATGYAPLYLSTPPDFSAFSENGTQLDVVVLGSEGKARRTAADVHGAMLPLGISDPDNRVVAKENVVAVFADSPSRGDRDAVSACLEGRS